MYTAWKLPWQGALIPQPLRTLMTVISNDTNTIMQFIDFFRILSGCFVYVYIFVKT